MPKEWKKPKPTEGQRAKAASDAKKTIARNKKARHDYTIVPLELYFIGGRVKVEIALAKGKQEWDKRQALREKQDQREAERAMRRYVKQARR